MPKFSRGLIQSLANPTFTEDIASLGDKFTARRKEVQELKAIQSISSIGTQGVAAAQSGNVVDLENHIKNLQDLITTTKNPIQATTAQNELIKLQGLIPDAKNKKIQNDVNELFIIEKKLNAPGLSEDERKTLENRQNELNSNPLVVEQFGTRSVQRANFENLQKQEEFDTWYNQNKGDMRKAIQDDDNDALEEVIGRLPEELGSSFNKVLLAHVDIMRGYREDNKKIAKELEEKQTEPINTDLFTDRIEALGGEDQRNFLNSLVARYEKYKNEYWDSTEGTWKGNSRITAKKLEETIFKKIDDAFQREADTNLGIELDEVVRKKDELEKAEKSLDRLNKGILTDKEIKNVRQLVVSEYNRLRTNNKSKDKALYEELERKIKGNYITNRIEEQTFNRNYLYKELGKDVPNESEPRPSLSDEMGDDNDNEFSPGLIMTAPRG